jgi:hypothetical protein
LRKLNVLMCVVMRSRYKKRETSVARCLPNTPIDLCSVCYISYSNIIVIVCD